MQAISYYRVLLFSLLLTPWLVFSQTRYEVPINSLERLPAAQYAAYSQVGINKFDNPDRVMLYLNSVGLDRMLNFCAAGVHWSYIILSNDSSFYNNTGVAQNYFSQAKKQGRKTAYIAQSGDLIVWRKIGSWEGHIELVLTALENNRVLTIGFNTSPGNNRTGGGVYIRERLIYGKMGTLEVMGLVGFYEKN